MKNLKRSRWVVLTAALGLSVLTSPAFAADSGVVDILRQGLLGAGTGAISAGSSGGNAGKGALIGAGTNVIGGALIGLLTEPSSNARSAYSSPTYYASYPQPAQAVQPVYYSSPVPVRHRTTKTRYFNHPRVTVQHIVRRFDPAGRLISEEEFWE